MALSTSPVHGARCTVFTADDARVVRARARAVGGGSDTRGADSSSAASGLHGTEPTLESDAAEAERTAHLNIDGRRILGSFRGVTLHHDRQSDTGYRNVERRPEGKFAATWLTRFPRPILLAVRDTAVEAALAYADCVKQGGPNSLQRLAY